MESERIKILAIDDNQDNLISLKALVMEAFPQALTLMALNGRAGLELAAREDPDVILLDVLMPEMDGFEVCEKLKADQKLSEIPVVFVTAMKGEKESRIRALECGAEAFLAKPIDESELTAQIRAMVKIKAANIEKRDEKARLATLVAEQTIELKNSHFATLKLLEDLKKENEARKSSEAALKDSEEKFSKAFLSSPYAITITRIEDGHFIEINDTFTAITGFSREEAIADSSIGLNLWVDTEERKRIISALMEGGNVKDREVQFRKKSGDVINASFCAQMINLKDKTFIISSINDITEHRKLEEQLRQSQKMEAIGQLAGGVAHDFNNMLMVIIGYCNMLRMSTEIESAAMERIEHINAAAEKAAQLTRGLLAFSRKQIMDIRPVNLNDIVQHVQKFLIRIIGEDIQLKFVSNGENLTAMADAGQIEQVLMNLATNARDAMPKGGLLSIETSIEEITAELAYCHGCDKPGRYALISVSDTGSGMDDETRCRIFEPFYTTKGIGKGTGLGMSIVHGIVTQHNGFIVVSSETDKGTTFKLYIPLVDAVDLKEEKEIPAELPKGGRETILVAEDDASLRKFVETLLTDYGYDVLPAEDGDDAVKKFKANLPKVNLVLMDMIMPKKSGMEAYKEIQSIQNDVKVLFTSGYAADFIQSREELDLGADLIMKPVKPIELLKKLREMLDRGVQR
jgi:PAS domain S-box-containing protein